MTDDKKPRTAFDNWVIVHGMTSQQAADLLDMHLSRIQELRAGRRYGTDTPALPDRVLRYAMAAINAGLNPWPAWDE